MFSELLSKSIDFDGSTSISALTMLVLQHDVPVLEEETLSLCEKQYENAQLSQFENKHQSQNGITEPLVDWDELFYDQQMSSNFSNWDSFNRSSPFPTSLPSSNTSPGLSPTDLNFNSQSDLFSYFDFDNLINCDLPLTWGTVFEPALAIAGSCPSGETTTAGPSNYMPPRVDDITSLSDSDSPSALSTPSPLSLSPDDYLPSPPASTPMSCSKVLTAEEETRLLAIEMNNSSPNDSVPSSVSSSKTNSKRKAIPMSNSDASIPCSDSSTRRNRSKRTKVDQHNLIEKRYREKINERISSLGKVVPGLQGAADGEDASSPESFPSAVKINKATILSKAIEHILDLETQTKYLSKDNHSLKNRVNAYERLLVAPQTTARFTRTGSNE